jgi:UDP-N-acetylmuramate dehydrogenase
MAADVLAAVPGIRRDEPLAKHSQYGIGGPAEWYLEMADTERLQEVMRICGREGIAVSVVGAGSNTLILDGGVRGLVVRLTDKSWTRTGDATVRVAAATMMPRLALDLAKEGLSGMEFGIGVPGTCGASVRGNAGAFGAEIKDVLVSCRSVGPDGEIRSHDNAACAFGYRSSAFKSGNLTGHVVIGADFTVAAGDKEQTRRRTDEIQSARKASQPYGIRSLGSVFTNPPGDHAGRLIEAAGLKGHRIGGAEISAKHANFIVNADHATAADVLALVETAHQAVLERFGVDLEREIVIMGEPA